MIEVSQKTLYNSVQTVGQIMQEMTIGVFGQYVAILLKECHRCRV